MLWERTEGDLTGEVRIEGLGTSRIDDEGTIQIENLTATASVS
jgi:hypothetical protein